MIKIQTFNGNDQDITNIWNNAIEFYIQNVYPTSTMSRWLKSDFNAIRSDDMQYIIFDDETNATLFLLRFQ